MPSGSMPGSRCPFGMSRNCWPSEGLTHPTRRSGGFLKFGPSIAANIRRSRPRPSDHWHLDEMVISIRGGKYWLWRAVDNEGEVLDFLVQRRRDTQAAKKLMVKLLKKDGFAPSRVVTDRLRSYAAAFRAIGLKAEHDRGRCQSKILNTWSGHRTAQIDPEKCRKINGRKIRF